MLRESRLNSEYRIMDDSERSEQKNQYQGFWLLLTKNVLNQVKVTIQDETQKRNAQKKRKN